MLVDVDCLTREWKSNSHTVKQVLKSSGKGEHVSSAWWMLVMRTRERAVHVCGVDSQKGGVTVGAAARCDPLPAWNGQEEQESRWGKQISKGKGGGEVELSREHCVSSCRQRASSLTMLRMSWLMTIGQEATVEGVRTGNTEGAVSWAKGV